MYKTVIYIYIYIYNVDSSVRGTASNTLLPILPYGVLGRTYDYIDIGKFVR